MRVQGDATGVLPVNPERDVLLHVVQAIAEVEGVEVHELEYALHDHIYSGAIRGLLEGEYNGWELTFEVPGHEVTVRAGGEVYVDGELVAESEEFESSD